MSAFTVTIKDAGLSKKGKAREAKERHLPKPPSRIARMLALAYLVERLVDDGRLRNYAEAARTIGVTRARMTQVMNLLNLQPDIQERLILGRLDCTERCIRNTDSVGRVAAECQTRHKPAHQMEGRSS